MGPLSDVSVVGVDTAPALLARQRNSQALSNISFHEAHARSLPFDDHPFTVVLFDSTLSHVPGPERAIAEAFRVLRCIRSARGESARRCVLPPVSLRAES